MYDSVTRANNGRFHGEKIVAVLAERLRPTE
jgi:hypothetical protein